MYVVAWVGEIGNSEGILVGKPEGRRLCGLPSCRWSANVEMDTTEIGWDSVGCVYLASGTDR